MEKIIKLVLRHSVSDEKCVIDCYSREHAKQIIKNQIEDLNNDWRVIANNDVVVEIINELREEFNNKIIEDEKEQIITFYDFINCLKSDVVLDVPYFGIKKKRKYFNDEIILDDLIHCEVVKVTKMNGYYLIAVSAI